MGTKRRKIYVGIRNNIEVYAEEKLRFYLFMSRIAAAVVIRTSRHRRALIYADQLTVNPRRLVRR